MSSVLRAMVYGLPLLAWPAVAAVPGDDTGITSVAPAMFIFAIAAALLLTLVFRASARHAYRVIAQKLAGARIRRALRARSRNVLHDFILPGAYGGLAKIDHAVMTAGGILCIRALSLNGVIFCGEDEPQWTYVDGVKRRRFLNPLIQNEGRARALRNVVGNVPVENLVIFSGHVEFSSPPPKNVIRLQELESFVAKFVFGPSKIDDWDAVWLNLKSAVLTDPDSRKDLAAQIGFT